MAATISMSIQYHSYLEPSKKKPLSSGVNLVSQSQDPFSPSKASIKIRTPPWMNGPLLLQPDQVLQLSNPKPRKVSDNEKPDRDLTAKEVRGHRAVKKIVRSIEKLQVNPNPNDTYIDFSRDLTSDKRLPWVRENGFMIRRMKKEKVVTKAELILDEELLVRLRGEARRIRKWVKVKKAGVTQTIVDEIKLIWKWNELAMLKFDLPLSRNMDRATEIVELKTGGLVIWSRNETLVVYRGCADKINSKAFEKINSCPTNVSQLTCNAKGNSVQNSFLMENRPANGSLFERETDRLLDGLGPRFVDWWMAKPLPVDADLLPEVVPGFTTPRRLCPSVVRPQLTDFELTHLRKSAQTLPTHFALGKNRSLQGLAASILKLWDKSRIAKIAVKCGVQNTDNERMANELRNLTGGVILLRNRFYIILYRGKNFLPCPVADLVLERETKLKICQTMEEDARQFIVEDFSNSSKPLANNSSSVGTLSEFQDILSKYTMGEEKDESELHIDIEKQNLKLELKKQERKLFILMSKINRSTKSLLKLNSKCEPGETEADLEMITIEERACLRRIGLKTDSSLVLGRRGIFDGVIEGIYQHWKHREVVKVITMQRAFAQVMYTAKLLEAKSGGILVSVEKLREEGHAIIIYRGKNYRRPPRIMSQNLLSKREAYFRSIELQRLGSLKFFAYQRQQSIAELKIKLAELEEAGQESIEKIHEL